MDLISNVKKFVSTKKMNWSVFIFLNLMGIIEYTPFHFILSFFFQSEVFLRIFILFSLLSLNNILFYYLLKFKSKILSSDGDHYPNDIERKYYETFFIKNNVYDELLIKSDEIPIIKDYLTLEKNSFDLFLQELERSVTLKSKLQTFLGDITPHDLTRVANFFLRERGLPLIKLNSSLFRDKLRIRDYVGEIYTSILKTENYDHLIFTMSIPYPFGCINSFVITKDKSNVITVEGIGSFIQSENKIFCELLREGSKIYFLLPSLSSDRRELLSLLNKEITFSSIKNERIIKRLKLREEKNSLMRVAFEIYLQHIILITKNRINSFNLNFALPLHEQAFAKN